MSCSGDGRTKLTPVAELLPFEGGLLDEESAQREAEAFSEALVPEHAVHAGQPALWWSQSAAQRSSLLVPDLPSRRAGTGLIGQPWGQPMVRRLPYPCSPSCCYRHAHEQHMALQRKAGSILAGISGAQKVSWGDTESCQLCLQGAREGARAGSLHSARLSLPDCCMAGGNATAAKERVDAMLAMPRSLSVPDPPFDDLMTQLGGPVDEEAPLSAGLDTLDMHLSSMELTPGMQGELMH